MNFIIESPESEPNPTILTAMLGIGRQEMDTIYSSTLPTILLIQMDSAFIYPFRVLKYEHILLPYAKVDEVKVEFQDLTFYIAHIRNPFENSKVLSTIRRHRWETGGWTVQSASECHHLCSYSYLTVWSKIDLPHMREFQESGRWLIGLSWEEFYMGLLFFTPELPDN
jgi:hypothetical protein